MEQTVEFMPDLLEKKKTDYVNLLGHLLPNPFAFWNQDHWYDLQVGTSSQLGIRFLASQLVWSSRFSNLEDDEQIQLKVHLQCT